MKIDIEQYRQLLPLQPSEMQEQGIPLPVQRRAARLRELYAHWVQYSALTTPQMVQYDMQQHGTQRTVAYEDIQALKAIVGELQKATADFHRWRINAIIEADMQAAREAEDWKSVAAMQKNYIAANRLDKPDEASTQLADIVPMQIIPTDDPSALGIGPQKNLRKRVADLLKKYAAGNDQHTHTP